MADKKADTDNIVSAVLAGVVEARHTYAAWTGNGGYFAWAPEYLLTVSVAQAVWDWCAPLTVWPEFRLGDAVRDSGPTCSRATVQLAQGDNRRADLLIYGRDLRPCAVVEIKRNVDGWGRIADDVERLCSVVARKSSSFELGVVAFNCTHMAPAGGRGRGVLADRLRRLGDFAGKVRRPGWNCRLISGRIDHDGHEYWSAAVVVVERKRVKTSIRAAQTLYSPCESTAAQVPSPP
jgi:hypothetical protein